MKFLLLLSVILSLAGCTLAPSPTPYSISTSAFEYSGMEPHKTGTSLNPGQFAESNESDHRPLSSKMQHMVLVGTVGPLLPLPAHEANRAAIYDTYKSYAELQTRTHTASLSYEQFFQNIAGHVFIHTFDMTVLFSLGHVVAVPIGLIDKIDFPPAFASEQLNLTGDLVVAKAYSDGLLVIDKILCQAKTKNYSECAKKYADGRFDAASGKELDSHNEPKKNGAVINVHTYQRVQG